MKLTEFYEAKKQWLIDHRHPKTVNETRLAAEAFTGFLGYDPLVDDVTAEMVEKFEGDKSHRRRQLVSNLLGLLRLYDANKWPRKNKTTFAGAMARRDSIMVQAPKAKSKVRTLVEFAAVYISQRTLSAGYRLTLIKRAENYQEFHGTTIIKKLMTEEALNTFLAALDGTGSPVTVAKWRQDLLTLWSAAADDDLCEYPRRRRIRKPKRDATVIECYTPDEARALVSAAERLKGGFDNGTAKRHYWAAIIRMAWDTGLRRGDLWQWERDTLQADGTFKLLQHKTRKPIRRKLRPATIKALDKLEGEKPLTWPMKNEWSFGFQFQRIIAAAGVERGTFKWLRRACGSEVEAANPGAGHRALGNTTQVFNQHYNADLASEVLMPTEL